MLCWTLRHAAGSEGLRQCGDTDEEQSEEFRNGDFGGRERKLGLARPGSAWPGPARPDEWTLLRLSLSVSSSFQHDNLCTAAAPAVSLCKTRPSHTPLCLLSIRPLSSPLTLISPPRPHYPSPVSHPACLGSRAAPAGWIRGRLPAAVGCIPEVGAEPSQGPP